MNTVRQSLALYKVLAKNDRNVMAGRKETNGKKKVAKFVSFAILGAFFCLIFAFQFFVFGKSVAETDPSKLPAMLTSIYFIVQILILILGLFTVIGTMFFSKDTTILSSLPIKKSAIFIAKFARCYVSELIISAALTLVLVTAYAVGAIVGGAVLSAWFFIIEVISLFFMPAIPLLIISFIAFPVVFLGNQIKKSRTLKAVFSILGTLLLTFAVMIPSIFLNMTPTNSASFGVYDQLANFTVFNLPLTNAMFGINAAANFFGYFGILIAGFVIAIVISALTYPKILAGKSDGKLEIARRNKKELEYGTLSFRKTYLKKEIKTILGTGTLLAAMLLPVILLPVMVGIFTGLNIFSGFNEAASSTDSGLFSTLGFVLYLSCLVSVSSNQIALMGFSIEGKNVLFLKTLPISAKEMVKLKLKLADIFSLIISFIVAITYVIASPSHDIVLTVFLLLSIFGFGKSFNRFGLYNDLKNPFLNWQNIQEINKNNRRSLKPMLTALGLCLVFMILGFALEFIMVNIWLKYLIFALTAFTAVLLVYFLTAKKLYDNADELWEKIEI